MNMTNETGVGVLAIVLGLGLVPACGDDPIIEASSAETGATETGDGDGDATGSETSTTDNMSGDGDGDMTGDGDGDPATGDGDGDMSGDGDGDTTGDGDGDTTGDGDGDPMTGDGDGDGDPMMDDCGNGVVDNGEGCDDQNDDNTDGCLSNCTIATSCLDIINADPEAEDGMYTISPKPDTPWMAECDMTTDGGGWTALTLEHTCNGNLDSSITEVDDANTFDTDDACRPYTRDGLSAHTYYWDIEFPPTFESFYLSEYNLRANAGGIAESEISVDQFIQSDWNDCNGNDYGDVSFGSASENGPTTSFADAGADFECEACEEAFPQPDMIFDLAGPSSALRIGWGESGIESEGWYPWFSGTIWIR